MTEKMKEIIDCNFKVETVDKNTICSLKSWGDKRCDEGKCIIVKAKKGDE